MSKKYPGGYLTKTPPTVSTTSAQGVWTLEQAEYYQNAGLWPIPPDPYFNQVSLLLHGDGTNGSQNNTFLDSSTNNFTITRTGNVAQGTFSPFSLAEGQWSNYFDGSGDYLSGPASQVATQPGSGDFTIEFFAYLTSALSGGAYHQYFAYSGGTGLRVFNNNEATYNNLDVWIGSSRLLNITTVLSRNTWQHIAIVRSSGVLKAYVNGVSVGTYSTSTTLDGDLQIADGSTYSYAGYISNFRLVKGTAVYTSAFTPPTSPLTAITNTSLLTCQSNRFVDNSANNFTITPYGDTKVTAFSPFAPSAAYSASTNGGSGYFDGNGDQLRTSGTGLNDFGTGDFTIESFVYITPGATSYNNYGRTYLICPNPIETYGANNLGININGSTIGASGIQVVYNSSALINYTTAIPQGVWNHIAVTRSSGTMYLFINGVSVASVSSTQSFTNVPISVGGLVSTNQIYNDYLNGYASNFRIVKGTAVYTSNFTPPTAPLTAVTNTQLLLNCTNAAIYDNAGKNDIETVGNAQISTSVKKYGTGSMYFDGTGDYLTLQPSVVLNGDFTLECWVYSTGNEPDGYSLIFSSSSPNSTQIGYTNSGALVFYAAAWIINQVGTAVTQNAWHHVAFSRSGSTVRGFVDGVQIASGTLASTTAVTVTRIGAFISGGYEVNGYLDDIRITNGVARYTANFTPPNGPFPNV